MVKFRSTLKIKIDLHTIANNAKSIGTMRVLAIDGTMISSLFRTGENLCYVA